MNEESKKQVTKSSEIEPVPVLIPPKSAMLIVLEENGAQGYSVTWKSIYTAMSSAMKMGFGDLDLNLPSWLRALIRKSGKVADKIVSGIRNGILRMMDNIFGETRKTLHSDSIVNLDPLLKELLATLPLPNGFNSFKNLYGEAAFAAILEQMAKPHYDKVVVLSDKSATFDNFKETLLQLHNGGYLIDILLDIHGFGDSTTMNNNHSSKQELVFTGSSATPQQIRDINNGDKINLNAVYMLSCWGSNFNQPWLDLGAKASNGSQELNYYVLLSPFAFMSAWTTERMTLSKAAQMAYDLERTLLNGKDFKVRITVGREPITNERITWSTSIGVTWRKLMDKLLARDYGQDKSKPVNNVASSKRIHAGNANTRHA